MLNTLLTLISSVVLAVTNPQGSGDITNSATIAVSTIVAPVLITPGDGTLTNNRFEAFSWQISTPSVNISHYTLYLDGVVVSSYIPHSTAIDNIVSTTLTTPIQDGTHTWYVIAYSTGSTSAQSEVHTFYVDATIPIIILQAVDKNTMYWTTNDPSTIPTYPNRHLTVTTKNPLLSGKIEALSNFKLSLVCPSQGSEPVVEQQLFGNLDNKNCQPQTTTTNDPDGNWKHRFYNLIPNTVYTAYLTATDAAGNTNIFPEFTITYTPTPLISLPFFPTPTPTAVPTPTQPTDLSPTPPLDIPDYKLPPPAPPRKLPDAVPTPVIPAKAGTYLIYLSLFGLLLHLSMTAFGAGVRLKLIPNLLLILFWPFLKARPYKTNLAFTTILLYDPETNKLKYSNLSNLKNSFDLPSNNNMFIKASFPGYEPFSTILNNEGQFVTRSQDPKLWPGASLRCEDQQFVGLDDESFIQLNPKPSKTLLEELQSFSLSTRSLALVFSMLTAIISLIFTINLPASLLLLAGLDLLYTEYIAPKGVQP